MSYTVDSPVKYYPGHIVMSEDLSPEQCAIFDRCMAETQKGDRVESEVVVTMLPGIIACIQEWHIEKQPAHPTTKTFKFNPRKSSGMLYSWLFSTVLKAVIGEEEIPNGLPPKPTDTPEATAENLTS